MVKIEKKDNSKETIDRSVIEPISIDFCDDDSDDDTGWSIITFKYNRKRKNVKIE